MQLFQGQKKPPAPKPAETASSGPSLPSVSLPSVSLPSVGLPSVSLPGLPTPDLSGLNVSTGGGIDPRTIALPGKITRLIAQAAPARKMAPPLQGCRPERPWHVVLLIAYERIKLSGRLDLFAGPQAK